MKGDRGYIITLFSLRKKKRTRFESFDEPNIRNEWITKFHLRKRFKNIRMAIKQFLVKITNHDFFSPLAVISMKTFLFAILFIFIKSPIPKALMLGYETAKTPDLNQLKASKLLVVCVLPLSTHQWRTATLQASWGFDNFKPQLKRSTFDSVLRLKVPFSREMV